MSPPKNPPPTVGVGRDTVDLVQIDLARRKQMGWLKYGVAHQHDNGRDHLLDLYEELLDACVYIRAELERREDAEDRRIANEPRRTLPYGMRKIEVEESGVPTAPIQLFDAVSSDLSKHPHVIAVHAFKDHCGDCRECRGVSMQESFETEDLCAAGQPLWRAVLGDKEPQTIGRLLENLPPGYQIPIPCRRCHGCKQIANTSDGEAWTEWSELPAGSDLAVRMGIIKPIPCPECS